MKSYQDFLEEQHIIDVLFDEGFNEWLDSKTGIITERMVIPTGDVTQPWEKDFNKKEFDKLDVDTKKLKLKQLYEKMLEYVKAAQIKFSRGLKTVTRKIGHAKLLADIKKFGSVVDKVIARDKSPNKMTDILRAAILVPTWEDVQKVVKAMPHVFDIVEYEIKDKGQDAQYGYYGSHHYLVNVGGVKAEIQLMTKKMWSYKEQAHKIYTKYRSLKDVDDKLKKLDLELSKKIFKLGNKGNITV